MYSPRMPSLTKKMHRTGAGLRAVAVFAAAASLALSLSGCANVDATAPSTARAHPPAGVQARASGT